MLRASLNLSARVDKSSIYYCEYCTVSNNVRRTVCIVYTVHCTIIGGAITHTLGLGVTKFDYVLVPG